MIPEINIINPRSGENPWAMTRTLGEETGHRGMSEALGRLVDQTVLNELLAKAKRLTWQERSAARTQREKVT